jgi:thiol-disulfide isomerase/thioredoxin
MKRLACLVASLVFVTSACPADDLPRYKLPVGRVLHYTGEGSSKEKDSGVPGSVSRSAWRFTVIAQNADGSARVLARSATSYGHRGNPGSERVAFAAFDLFPDGRQRVDPADAMQLNPRAVFPRLPADADQAKARWRGDVDWTGSRITFAPAANAPADTFTFTGDEEGPINRIYVTTQESTFHFDRVKGIVTRVDGTHSQAYGFHQTGTSVLKLDKEETFPPELTTILARDYAVYDAARKRARELMARVNDEPADAEKLVAAAKAALTSATDKLENGDIKRELKARIEEHDRYAPHTIEAAKKLAATLNKPAPDWSAKDLDDRPVSAQGLRGKVVVMDFWYRGCGWCMYAMPQVKQLAADYKDKPVVILGMNTDQKLDDARFVVKELALNYPQVQATGIPEKFSIQGFPTLVIIDPKGNLRDVHVGYSPDLREKVSQRIDALLRESDAAH